MPAHRTSGERRWAGTHLAAIQGWLVKRPDLRVDAVTGVTAPPLHTVVAAVVAQSLQKDPWGRERKCKDVGAIHSAYVAEAIGKQTTERRAHLILPLLKRPEVKGQWPLREVLTLKRYLEVDAYGTPFIVRDFGDDLDLLSAGPARELGTSDDQRWSTGHLELLESGIGGMGHFGQGRRCIGGPGADGQDLGPIARGDADGNVRGAGWVRRKRS